MTLETAPGAGGPNRPTEAAGLPLALERQLVSAAVAQLPVEYRAVLRRSFYEGRTTQQIANDLQIADSTVKARLHCAVRALRSLLQELAADVTTQSPLEAADQSAGLFRRDSDKANVSARSLRYPVGHNRQRAVGSGLSPVAGDRTPDCRRRCIR